MSDRPHLRTACQAESLRDQSLRPGIRRRASAYALRPPAIRLQRYVDARGLSLVLGVLAGLGLLGATLSFVVDLFVAPYRIFTADAEESLHLAASLIGLAGAFELHRGGRQGKPWVVASLAINVVATLIFSRAVLLLPETI